MHATCKTCGKGFEPQFTFQTKRLPDGAVEHYCSQMCANPVISSPPTAACRSCGKSFVVRNAYQVVTVDGKKAYVCSAECRLAVAPATAVGTMARRIAVLNQKGGTGKTTTAINIAAGLAERGHRTLLIDTDPQGSVGVSLGIAGERGMTAILRDGATPSDCAVPIRNNLDVITSDESLADVEILLARSQDGARELRRALAEVGNYSFVVLDCAPSITMLTRNVLNYAGEVIVPVACDYLSMIGTKQIAKTIADLNKVARRDIRITGVVPTFYDVRNRISHMVLDELGKLFGELLLPPIRINTRLKEAPVHRKTIFEYAPDSHGAEDYKVLVERLAGRV